ncbi:hypothetical protein [Priestia megaterium]|uniref:hypothetical protein n=1 Tax=Priestia megaterium TaxID=1404 RepID=UPI001C4717EF|nr:hypothetical protein [Priestia megaterium]MBV6738150.1 hypothetical protein [Priestia megaterium]
MKQETKSLLEKEKNIPEYINLQEAAIILEVEPEQVRDFCETKILESVRIFEEDNHWKINTDQFFEHPNWNKFLESKERVQP